MEKFTITKDHLKLLKRMYVGWSDCEYGAPYIDPKRPYGNSDVENDIAEILGWKKIKDRYGDEVMTESQSKKAAKIHLEMKDVLQICLQFLQFKTGTFKRENSWSDWEKVVISKK